MSTFSLFLTELYKMVCEPDETDLNIHIPAVMLPQDAGLSLERMLLNSSSGSTSVSIRDCKDIEFVFRIGFAMYLGFLVVLVSKHM